MLKIQFDGKKCRTLKMNQVLFLLLIIDSGSRGYELRGGINTFDYECCVWLNTKKYSPKQLEAFKRQ